MTVDLITCPARVSRRLQQTQVFSELEKPDVLLFRENASLGMYWFEANRCNDLGCVLSRSGASDSEFSIQKRVTAQFKNRIDHCDVNVVVFSFWMSLGLGPDRIFWRRTYS
jgi:hypothetical protein